MHPYHLKGIVLDEMHHTFIHEIVVYHVLIKLTDWLVFNYIGIFIIIVFRLK